MRFICALGICLVSLTNVPMAAAASFEEAEQAFNKQEYKQAFQIYMSLAEQGVPEAMVRVADMYSGCCGIRYNASEALQWYHAAAQKGNTDGAFEAAQLFQEGRGTDQNYKAAAKLYRQAADAGHAKAAVFLGELYLQGRGVDEDLEQAVALFRVGVEEGISRARAWMKALKKQGRLAPDGSVVDKSSVSVECKPAAQTVTVKGVSRQTITAVRTDTKPVHKVKEVEDDMSRSEAWAMTLTGVGFQLVAVLAFFFPKVFMYGRRSFFWRDLIGERATAVMIRVISFIISILGIGFILLGGSIITGG